MEISYLVLYVSVFGNRIRVGLYCLDLGIGLLF